MDVRRPQIEERQEFCRNQVQKKGHVKRSGDVRFTYRASGGCDERQNDRQHRREAYLQTAATSIAATRTDYSAGTTTAAQPDHPCMVRLSDGIERLYAIPTTL
jgi:hypothetical protein